MALRCLFWGSLAGLLVVLPARPAAAEGTAADKASAEALFDAALRLMKGGHYAEACPKLENSQRIDPGVGTLLYLGECYDHLGRTASAWATFREAASQADATGQTRRANAARERIDKLEGELAYLTIDVAEATRKLPGLHVKRNGQDAGLGIIGAAVPVDPGTVKIEVSAPDHESFTVSVAIEPRARQTVLIPTLAEVEKPPTPSEPAVAPAPATPAPAQPALPPAPVAESNPGATQRVIGLVVAGAGLVGVGVGSYFGLAAIGQEKKADRACSPTLCQDQTGFDHSDKANSDATLSNIMFAVGGGLFATGAVVYLLAPSKSSTASMGVAPVVAPHYAGVGVRGTL